MRCVSPLFAWRARRVGPSGKRALVFNPADGFHDMPVTVGCGQCVGCKLKRSHDWAVRCVHEASLHDENCFITVTYDDEHLPPYGTLVKSDFQKFMKRLRKFISPRRVRYYYAGEYGDKNGRPHYHACLFGYDFPDKVAWSVRNSHPTWRSAILERLWPCGQSEIGSVTFESAAYVARYIMKKALGLHAEVEYLFVTEDGEFKELTPEFTDMSRRPGIGKPWIDQYLSEVYPSDCVVVRGKLMKPPRYYDVAHELVDPGSAAVVCRKRQRARKPEEETHERLEVAEKVMLSKLTLSPRSL